MNLFADLPLRFQFPPLPDPYRPSRWALTDRTNFPTLLEDADIIMSTCPNGVGYSITGVSGSIGLAIWPTNSFRDRYIKDHLPTAVADAGLVGNSTLTATN